MKKIKATIKTYYYNNGKKIYESYLKDHLPDYITFTHRDEEDKIVTTRRYLQYDRVISSTGVTTIKNYRYLSNKTLLEKKNLKFIMN